MAMVIRPWTIIKDDVFLDANTTSFDSAYRLATEHIGAGGTVEVDADNKIIEVMGCRHINQTFIMEMTPNFATGDYEPEPVGRECTICGETTERWR